MPIRSTLLRLADPAWRIGASWLIATFGSGRLDGSITDWRTWLGAVALGFSVWLFWGGVGRIPLPRLPLGLREWFANRQRAEWDRKHAELLEPGDHEVVMTAVGNRPINVVKAVREFASLSLIDAKIAIEKPGGVLVGGRSEASCSRIVHMLSAVGATAATRRTGGSTSE